MRIDSDINDQDFLLGVQDNSKIKKIIINSPMPPKSDFHSDFKDNQNEDFKQEKTKINKVFFGTNKYKVWKNALKWNQISEKSVENKNEFRHENNPFSNVLRSSESFQEGDTPSFWKKISDKFKFGESKRGSSLQKSIQRLF